MTTNEEMNLKIAEWMGEVRYYIYSEGNGLIGLLRDFPTKEAAQSFLDEKLILHNDYNPDEFGIDFRTKDYHSDWNALMGVVERVEKQPDVREVEMYLESCRIRFVTTENKYPIHCEAESKIRATYTSVYNYITQQK